MVEPHPVFEHRAAERCTVRHRWSVFVIKSVTSSSMTVRKRSLSLHYDWCTCTIHSGQYRIIAVDMQRTTLS